MTDSVLIMVLSLTLTILVVVYLLFARKESIWNSIKNDYRGNYSSYDYQFAKTKEHRYLLLKALTAIISLINAAVLLYLFFNFVNR